MRDNPLVQRAVKEIIAHFPDANHIKQWLQEIIDNEEPRDDVAKATELLSRMDDLAEEVEKKKDISME